MKKETEREAQRKFKETFNQASHKETPENQNQSHNVVREGTGPINEKK